MDKKWQLLEAPPAGIIDRFPHIDPIGVALLVRRGLADQEAIDEFLNPDYAEDTHDPFLFRQMKEAVERLFLSIRNDEQITIHGDYDADGLSGAVILFSTLEYLGAKKINVYLPDREREGYGLNANTVSYLHGQGTKLIITCDCGISNAEEIDTARTLGMDVIVTDHHTQKNKLPSAILLHPKVEGETYPFKDLAGGGVAFKFAQALLRTAAGNDLTVTAKNEAFEKWLLDMVAISSVADMVPLIGENRTLVKYGLTVLSKARRPGLRAIMATAGIWPAKNGREPKMTATDIGFTIAPRLNAAGRMDHANAAFAAVMAKEQNQAAVLAETLEKTNRSRQTVTEKIMAAALSQIGDIGERKPQVITVYDADWSVGVAGLIASRLIEKFYLPVFVFGEINGKIAGSGRGIEGFDCTAALQATNDLYLKYGGHPAACGLTLADNSKLDEFKQRMNAFAATVLTSDHLQPRLLIDEELPISRIQWPLQELLQSFEPFGMGNPQPKFLSRRVEIVEMAAIGQQKNHLRLVVTQDHQVFRKMIGFRFGQWIELLRVGAKIDIVYTIEVNEWNGNRELQLKLVDLRLSE